MEHLLAKRQSAVRQLLAAARDRLDTLANTLLKEETLGDTELLPILGPRPEEPLPGQSQLEEAVHA